MKKSHILLAVILCCITGSCAFYTFHKKLFLHQKSTLFSTQHATKRTISRLVYAEGTLEASEQSKIGPLINGTIEKILVKEDQHVKKGTLLATINNGFGGDTEVRLTQANLTKAEATLTYTRLNHARQLSLFESGQLARDNYENSLRILHEQEADVHARQAEYDKALALYNATRVLAPYDGTILSVSVKEGEGISIGSATTTIMFEMVKDLSAMQANLSIDESRMGNLQKGMRVTFTVDAFPKKHWVGIITGLSKAPLQKSGSSERTVSYKAIINVEGDLSGLLTGMTAHAKIKLSKAKNVLSLPGHVFQLNPLAIKHIAQLNNFAYQPLDEATKKAHKKQHTEQNIQTIWVAKDKAFVETIVKTGIDDNAYFEILEGITSEDEIVFDVTETDTMRAFLKQVMGGGL